MYEQWIGIAHFGYLHVISDHSLIIPTKWHLLMPKVRGKKEGNLFVWFQPCNLSPPKKLQQSVWMKLLWETSGEQPHYACNKALLTAHRLSTVFGLNYKTNSRTDSQISKFCLRICWLNYFDSCCFFLISFLIYSDIVPSKPIYRLL